MARTNNVIDSYESGSAKDRAELIYTHYCSFEAILSDMKDIKWNKKEIICAVCGMLLMLIAAFIESKSIIG